MFIDVVAEMILSSNIIALPPPHFPPGSFKNLGN
jgi:hypothetical protein